MSIRKLILAPSLVLLVVASASAQNPKAKSTIDNGNKLFAEAKYELAIQEYRRVSESDPDIYVRSIYNIGVCHFELWRTDEAIAFFKQAIQLKQGNYPRASYALGVAFEEQKRYSEARNAYQESIEASRGENALATYRLGILLANDGDLQTAAKHFKQASKLRGEHVPASHNNLGVMFARLGRLAEAESEFLIALRQSGIAGFTDAEHNLKLCRLLRATANQLAPNVNPAWKGTVIQLREEN